MEASLRDSCFLALPKTDVMHSSVQAEQVLRKSLVTTAQAINGDSSLAAMGIQTHLAGLCIARGKPEKALPLLQGARNGILAGLGAEHPDTALAQCRLAACLADLHRYLPIIDPRSLLASGGVKPSAAYL
jgi:hypothetical protein